MEKNKKDKNFVPLPTIDNRKKGSLKPTPLPRIIAKEQLSHIDVHKKGNNFVIRDRICGTTKTVKKVTSREARKFSLVGSTACSHKREWGYCFLLAGKHYKNFYKRVHAWRPIKPPKGSRIAIAFYEKRK